MWAIIETGGKQYRVKEGDRIRVEKIGYASGMVSFEKVLLVADGETIKVGTPYVAGAKVGAKVLRDARADKKIVFRYHSKTRYRKKKGHRQPYLEVQIGKVA